MTARERLPNRRAAVTFELEAGGLRYTCTVGRYEDGAIGELFLGNHKSNSAADTNARDAAVTSRSQFSTAPILNRFVTRFVAIHTAARAGR
jgi:hypothetical protein